MKPVTDPNLLAQLDGGAPKAPKAVENPDVLALLNGDENGPDPYQQIIGNATIAARPFSRVVPPLRAELTDPASAALAAGAARDERLRQGAANTAAGGPTMRATTVDDLDRSPLEMLSDVRSKFRSGAMEGLSVLPELPVNAINAASKLAHALFGGDAILPDYAPLSQPDFVRDLSSGIREDSALIEEPLSMLQGQYDADASAIAQSDEGFWAQLGSQIKYGVKNPGSVAGELSRMGGQMTAGGVIPGAPVTVQLIASGLQAGGLNASQVREELLAAGKSEEEIDQAVASVFGPSAVINSLLPKLFPGGTAVEKALAGQVGRGTSGAAARIAIPTVGEAVTEGLAEGADQGLSNLATGKPLDQGLGAAVGAGVLPGGVMGGTAGTIDAVSAAARQADEVRATEDIVKLLGDLGVVAEPADIAAVMRGPEKPQEPASAPAATSVAAPQAPQAPAAAPAARTPFQVAEVIDNRIAELDAAAADGAMTPQEIQDAVAEADELKKLLAAQRKLRDSGALRSPTNSLTETELDEADARLTATTQRLEKAKAARSAAKQREKVQKRLDRIDNDADLSAYAEKLAPFNPVATAATIKENQRVQAEGEEGSRQEGVQEGQGGAEGEGSGRVPGEAQADQQGLSPRQPASAPVAVDPNDPLSPRAPAESSVPEGATRESLLENIRTARSPGEKSAAAGALAAFDKANPRAPTAQRRNTESPLAAGVRAKLGTAYRGVNVLSNRADLDPEVAAKYGVNSSDNDTVEGFYDPQSGQVYVFEDQLDTSSMPAQDRAIWVAAHERLGHAGFRGKAKADSGGDIDAGKSRMNTILKRSGQNPTIAAVAKAMEAQRPERGPILFEEALSELAAAVETGNYAEIESRYGITIPQAQRDSLAGYIARLIEAIRSTFGFSDAVPDSEIYTLVKDANRYSRENDASPTSRATPKRQAPVAQRVFQGSPTKEIERMSLEKVGTGEGNAAFGWGMYFASRREIAENYRAALSSISKNNGGRIADILLQKYGGDRVRAIEEIKRLRNVSLSDYNKATNSRLETDTRAEFLAKAETFIRANNNRGQTYQVEVPEDSELMNWDKEFMEQPDSVRRGMKAVWDLMTEDNQDYYLGQINAELQELTGSEFYQIIERAIMDDSIAVEGEALTALEAGRTDKPASLVLNDAGIPGLRYADGATRGSKDPTYNYVIWREEAIGKPEPLIASRAARLLKSLTPNEQKKVTDKVAEKIIAQLTNLPSKKEMAAVAVAGSAKRGWYKQSAQTISDVFGSDAPLFAGLLAALSPQIGVEGNLKNALNVFGDWVDAGRPNDSDAILDVMRSSLRRTFGGSLPAWENNSVRALQGVGILSGPKVDSFMRNLLGDVEEITNDAWMANYALVNQTIFKGGLNVKGNDPGKGSGYLAMNVRVRETARELTRLTGDTWTPAEVQETIWSWAKTLTEMTDSATEFRTAQEIVLDDGVTDELIASTPDFGTLFTQGDYRALLEDSGYADQLKQVDAKRAAAARSQQGAGARREASPFAPADQKRLEGAAAKRVDERRKQRLASDSAPVTEPEEDIPFSRRQTTNVYGPDQGSDLEGLPVRVRVGETVYEFHGYEPAQSIAARYAAKNGNTLPTNYAVVDEDRAARIADAYDKAKHQPQDPETQSAYAAMIEETLAQYRDILKTGLKIEFITGEDPYAASPREAILDVVENNHLWVFPTTDGFGSSELDVSDNPLLAETEFEISGRTALANDIFRVVHDYFGHIANGVGFRADGEENAWREHSAMYSPLARRAMTSETRGQNSWVNYGPQGDKNRTASSADTTYADQKTTLLPEWASEDGAGVILASRRSVTDTPELKSWFGDSKVVDENGDPLVVYHGTSRKFDAFESGFSNGFTIKRKGFYFTDAESIPGEFGSRTIAAYLSMQNPLDTRFDNSAVTEAVYNAIEAIGAEDKWSEAGGTVWRFMRKGFGQSDEFIDALKALGYDGLIMPDSWGNTVFDSYIAFEPSQIKSATENNGAFDPSNPSIIASRRPSFNAKPVQPDAVAVDAVHYGVKPGLKQLDPRKAGSAGAGRERRRFGMGVFGEQGGAAARLGFYVIESDDLPPAEDVVAAAGGVHPYTVRLTNLYDIDEDARDLVGMNVDATEEAISDAGFDGFVTEGPAGIEGRVAVVYNIGKKKIPVASEEGIVASRGRPRGFDSKTFGQVIIPAARRAAEQMDGVARWDTERFQMGVFDRRNSIEVNPQTQAEMEKAFAPVRELLRQSFGDTVRLYRTQDRNPTGERTLFSWSFSPDPSGGAAEFMPSKRPVRTAADIGSIIETLRSRGFVSVDGNRYVKSDKWPDAPDDYFVIYNRYGNYITDMVGVGSLREDLEYRAKNAEQENTAISDSKAMYSADVPVEQIKWIMPNAMSAEAVVARDPAASGDEIIASRRTPQQARAQRATLLGQLAANGFPMGSPTQQPGGRFLPLKQAADALRQKLQDAKLPLLRAQERTGATNAPGVTSLSLPDALNAYRLENLMHGRTRDRIEQADQKYVLRVQRMMKNTGVSVEQLEDFLLARHAPERNAHIASINPAKPDSGSGISTKQARDILAGTAPGVYSGKPLSAETRRDAAAIAAVLDTMHAETLANLVHSGQIEQGLATALQNRYPTYVPLRGQANAPDGASGQGTGRGLSVVSSGLKRALGRSQGSYAQNILGEMVGDLQRSIVTDEKSKVGQAFLRFVMANPAPDLYQVEPVDLEWKFSEATGEAYLGIKSSAEDADTTMIVRHNGKPVRIRFENEDMARAMINLDAPDLGMVLSAMSAINRWRSAVLTRYNPGFAPVNLTRDALLGATAITAEKGAAIGAKTAAYYPAALKAMWSDARSKPGNANASNPTMADYARQFAEAGGKTGITMTEDVLDLQRAMVNGSATLMQLAAQGKPWALARESVKRSLMPIVNVIEDFNDATENAIRLAVFRALREDGESIDRAAEYAKNVTINFNRKGELGPTLGAVYLFYNAAMQGTHAVFRVMKNPKVAALLGSLAVLQYGLAAAMMGDDDEDGITSWDKVPDYVKRTSLVIPLGWKTGNDDDYFSLPMPYGFNLFPYAGGRTAQFVKTGSRPTDSSMVGDIMSSTVEAFSPVPLAEGSRSMFGDTLGFLIGMYQNKDDFGSPIVADRYAPEGTPMALLGRADTPQAYHLAARVLARMGGGNLDQRIAPVGPLDVAPEQIEAMVGFATGGVGSIFNRAQRLGEQTSAGNLEGAMQYISATPIANRFAGTANDARAVADRYYGETGEFNRHREVLEEAFRAGKPEQYEEILANAQEREPSLRGMQIDRYKRGANKRDRSMGRTYDKGDPKLNSDGTPKLKPGEDSVFEEYRDAEKSIKAMNQQIRSLRASDTLTLGQVADMINSSGSATHYAPYQAPNVMLGLPETFDRNAPAPQRIRTRAIKVVQGHRAAAQKNFLGLLEEVRND